ncbi:MAG: hypothetical protein KDC24_05255 [Saprospiraceae bacterium]|nr:hypothetical protein [Saprospiraceae bacterium]
MNQGKIYLYLTLLLLAPFALQAQGETGSIALRTQAEIGFQPEFWDVPEIGNLRSSNGGFFQLYVDETAYLQLSNRISIGIGVGFGKFHAKEFNFVNGFSVETDANAFHLRTSLYTRFKSQFSEKMGMYHEIQFRYHIGKFERISGSGIPINGDVNIVGLGYNPIIYYKLNDRLHLEGSIQGITLFRTKSKPDTNNSFFFDPDINGRIRMGLLVGLSYYFPTQEEDAPKKKRSKRRKRR